MEIKNIYGAVIYTSQAATVKDAGDERLLCAVLYEKGEPN
jgi:hypothetical protein